MTYICICSAFGSLISGEAIIGVMTGTLAISTGICRLYAELGTLAAFVTARETRNLPRPSTALRPPRIVPGRRFLAKPGRTRQPACK
jgi:hypothetical protein